MSKVDLKILDNGTCEIVINDESTLNILKVLNYNIEDDNKITDLSSEAASNIVEIASNLSKDPDKVYYDTKLAMLRYAVADLATVINDIEKNPETRKQVALDSIFDVFKNRFCSIIENFGEAWATYIENDETEAETEEDNVIALTESDNPDNY